MSCWAAILRRASYFIRPGQSEYIYSFRLDTGGLSAQLNANGTVSLLDKESGEEKYRIPLPYMFDAAGERSDDVFYSLIPAGKDCYLLTVTAESKWINDEKRVFPVTIDPTIKPVVAYDTYINSSSKDGNYGSSTELWVSTTRTTFVKVTMPNISADSVIKSAYLYIYYYYYDKVTTGTITAGAYQVLNNWSESALTWNTANQNNNLGISTQRLSTVEMSGAIGAYKSAPVQRHFDITTAATAWYAGSQNYGIAIKYQSGTNESVIIHSSESDTAYRPYFYIDYEPPHIENGVYRIKNATNNMYLDTRGGGNTAGTAIQQWTTAASGYDKNQLYKITYLATRTGTGGTVNYYSIRPMTNCGLGLSAPDNSSGNVSLAEISTTENINYLDYAQRWIIAPSTNGYTLRNGYTENTNYMCAPANSTEGSQIITSSTSTRNEWKLEKYTGYINEAGFSRFTSTMIVGETFDFDGYMISSVSGHNGPVSYEVKSEDGNSSTDKATINEVTGEMTANKPGTVQVRMKSSYLDKIWFGLVTIEESLEGTYFFKNAELGNYMQIDNDAPTSSEGAILELWDYDGGNDQKWKIEFASNGYYKIISSASGKAITAPSKVDESLTQKTYTGANTQQWKIVKMGNGRYRFSPRSYSYTYMAAGDGVIIESGRNVELRSSQSDDKDVWYIRQPEKVKFSLIGIENSGHNHQSALTTVQEYLTEEGYNNISFLYGSVSASKCKSELMTSNIFTSRSHGHLVVWSGTTTAASTGIILNDKSGSDRIAFYSHSWSEMTSSSDFIRSGEDYSNIDVALFIACETAYDGNGGRNLITEIVNQGAKAAVGFEESINCSNANTWTKEFYKSMLSGKTLEEAVDKACSKFSDSSSLQSAIICGDKTVVFH